MLQQSPNRRKLVMSNMLDTVTNMQTMAHALHMLSQPKENVKALSQVDNTNAMSHSADLSCLGCLHSNKTIEVFNLIVKDSC